MWCVAELNDEYIAKMEDVLEIYERLYDAAEPVVCLDEKPVTLHADIRPPSPAIAGHGKPGEIRIRAVWHGGISSAPWNPRVAATSPPRPPIDRLLNSPVPLRFGLCSTRPPRRFIWSWTTSTPIAGSR